MSIRILLVGDDHERATVVATALRLEEYAVVGTLHPDDNLVRAVIKAVPTVVIVDIENMQETLYSKLVRLNAEAPLPVVMFCQDITPDSIQKATLAGVNAYVVDGLQNKRIKPVIDAARARFNQLHQVNIELQAARQKLA